jgi:hypothetical protein
MTGVPAHCMQGSNATGPDWKGTLWRFSLEEAFFLVHDLKAAHVYVEGNKELQRLSPEVHHISTRRYSKTPYHCPVCVMLFGSTSFQLSNRPDCWEFSDVTSTDILLGGDVQDLWTSFVADRSDFWSSYAAYAHYRRKVCL